MKSDFINCKNCTDDCHCKGKNITPICLSFKPAKITRADRIRAMTDEELAKWLVFIEQRILERQPMLERPALYADWLDWLKQEASDGATETIERAGNDQ